MIKTKVIALICLFMCCSCTTKTQLSADEIVLHSIKAHGGPDVWGTKSELYFTKKTITYNPDGSIKNTLSQRQSFVFEPLLKVEISWEDAQQNKHIIIAQEGKPIQYTINAVNSTNQATLAEAQSQVKSALYVISQPFDLMASKAELELLHNVQVNGIDAYAVSVHYKGDSTLSDQWTYFFDTKTYKCLGSKVQHGETASQIENLEFDTKTALVFNAYRKSYRLNTAGEKDYLIADYWYSDFVLN